MRNWMIRVIEFFRLSGYAAQRKVEPQTNEAKRQERLIEIMKQKNNLLIALVQNLHDSGSDIDKIAFRCIKAIEEDKIEATALIRCLKLYQSRQIRLYLWQDKLTAESGINLHVEASSGVGLLEQLVEVGGFNAYLTKYPEDLSLKTDIS